MPDERLVSVGYKNIDDVPVAVVPEKLPGPGTIHAGEEFAYADDAHDTISRLTRDGGGSTVDPRTGENLAKRDLWAVSEGSEFEHITDGMFTQAEYDAFAAKHADYLRAHPDAVFGTWDDRTRILPDGTQYTAQDHGKVELNITRTFEKQGDARNFAFDRDQWGFGNLADPRLDDPSTAGDAFTATEDAFGQARTRAFLDENVESRRVAREARYRAKASPEILEAFERGPSGRPRPQAQKDEILRNFSLMPEDAEGAGFALLGVEVARYYQSGGDGLMGMFGVDAPRFLSLKAALSPNIADANSSLATLEIWADWIDAGRTTSRDWMASAVDAGARKYGLTNWNLNNVERTLTVSDARLLEPDILEKGGLIIGFPKGPGLQEGKDVLSGLKISPYYGNLMQELQRLVMDTHVRGSVGFTRGNAAKKLEVLGATPAFQAYADYLTATTGRKWTIAEVQAGHWGPVIALKEIAKRRLALKRGRGGGGGLKPGEQPEAFRDIPEILKEMGLEAQAGFSGLQPALGLEELAEEVRRAPNMMATFRGDDAQPFLKRLGIPRPDPVDDMSKLAGFLDDPEVRLGDILDMAKRIAQSTEDSLAGVIALLIGQGVMDSVNGRELIAALSEEAGLGRVGDAYDMDQGGTMEMLMLMGEQPDIEDEALGRFGDAMRIGQAPNLIRTLRGSAADPEPADGRTANIRRFGPGIVSRPDPVTIAPPPPIPRPVF
jgi:hypothetical protein